MDPDICRLMDPRLQIHPRLRIPSELFARSIAVSLLYIVSMTGATGITFTFQNNCPYTVWPGLLPNGGSPLLADGGFELEEGQTISLDAPVGWSGRFWGRTGCSFSSTPSPSAIACESGDCGNGKFQCGGTGAATPATLAEITLTGNTPTTKTDFYDVSLVDGYNIPIALGPSVSNSTTSSAAESQQHTSAAAAATNDYVCKMAGCAVNIDTICPQALQVLASETDALDGTGGSLVVGCKSACDAFGTPQYCCTGSYANPSTCTPTSYSQLFKQACPRAYSYAFDDATSIFTCTASAYSIIFCPSSLSQQNGASSAPNNSGARPSIGFCWAGFLGLLTLNLFASLIAP